MKVYIAGKYTGLPVELAESKFHKSEQELVSVGVDTNDIFNPVRMVPRGTPWNEAMNICLPVVRQSTVIFLQNDYNHSEGARLEYKEAVRYGLDIIFEKENGIEEIKNLIQCGII